MRGNKRTLKKQLKQLAQKQVRFCAIEKEREAIVEELWPSAVGPLTPAQIVILDHIQAERETDRYDLRKLQRRLVELEESSALHVKDEQTAFLRYLAYLKEGNLSEDQRGLITKIQADIQRGIHRKILPKHLRREQ